LRPPLSQALAVAARAVAAVMAGRNLNIALASALAGADAGRHAAVRDLAYTTLRAYGRGDFVLTRLLRKPVSEPAVRALLLVALARLDLRPDEAHTTVNQAVEAAATIAHGHFKGLVNGVLRAFLRGHAQLAAAARENDVAHWQHPAWWLARLQADHGQGWQAIADAGNSHPPMALRVNRRRIAAADYGATLQAQGIAARSQGAAAVLLDRPVPVTQLPGFAQGLVSVQDVGAQQAAPLLAVDDGMRVLDACAAPGGKSAHLLELADVHLTALDADAGRMQRVRDNLARLGLQGRLVVADCRDLAHWWDGLPFDRILADVPCSASGVVRRHPDVKWLRREADIAGFAAQQASILDALWRVLAPGGKLLYATCSVFSQENSRQVAAFAARHGDCVEAPMEGGGHEHLLLPQAEHDGFYYALVEKKN
jgi:16S rRNA (cytosine967-C5)-methyltransferase